MSLVAEQHEFVCCTNLVECVAECKLLELRLLWRSVLGCLPGSPLAGVSSRMRELGGLTAPYVVYVEWVLLSHLLMRGDSSRRSFASSALLTCNRRLELPLAFIYTHAPKHRILYASLHFTDALSCVFA